jgi:hypothetical protein
MVTTDVAEEEIVRAVERAGIMLDVNDDGEVTWQLLVHGINRLATQAHDGVGQYITMNRRLHRTESKMRLTQDRLDKTLRQWEEFKGNLDEHKTRTGKLLSGQTSDLAKERDKVHDLQAKLKKLRKRLRTR